MQRREDTENINAQLKLLDKRRLNIFLTVAGIVEVFIKARMAKSFPRVATRENTKSKTQKPRKKLLL